MHIFFVYKILMASCWQTYHNLPIYSNNLNHETYFVMCLLAANFTYKCFARRQEFLSLQLSHIYILKIWKKPCIRTHLSPLMLCQKIYRWLFNNDSSLLKMNIAITFQLLSITSRSLFWKSEKYNFWTKN